MAWYQFLTDLKRQVANILLPEHGGTGSTYGEERVVVKAINSTGSNIKLYSAVEPTFGANDLRITPVTTANSTNVMGSMVGYYGGDGVLVEADAPDGYEVGVQTAGIARFLIKSNVIRGQKAFTTTASGKITSSAAGSGAIGTVLDTAWLTQTSNTRVYFSATATASAAGGWDNIITKSTDESVTSSTTLQDDNELQFSPVSGGFYEFEAIIFHNAGAGATATDIKYVFMEDGTFRGFYVSVRSNSGTGAGEVIAGSVSTSSVQTAQTDNLDVPLICKGAWKSGGSTFKFQWAQNGSNVNALTVKAGSTLKYKRLA